ncbi:phage Gp37/Gp68 family protein [Phyllobacterium phragmitis]|uniref:Phage Gp37/Gp68 family protein n=1 Tax=Phyllobacterium phragmitis TaxID=2670329 RepID=A0A2S9IPA2_9HYPH|nr:phage Gp37/Gp68 family protein [Phyllobacterium phragmitis]PRD42358.1 phage Gp37/Gp68 family protein [Phyllobacterium phragmitis]
MADGTHIEWTDTTWNPITGCSVVSPGCTNCYAMRLAGTRLKHIPSRAGLTRDTKAGPVWTGEVRFNPQWLHQPSKWKRPRRIFVCAHGDLFAKNVPDQWILDVLTEMAVNDHHEFQVLTKRPERACEVLSREDLLQDIYANWYGFSGKPREVNSWPLHNVWLGVSAEDQGRYDARRRWLEETPAKVRFWSLEPLLGLIDLQFGRVKPDWVIVGGESGPGARPMHPDWVRSIRDQCAAADVPFFFKQWGSHKLTSDCNGPYMIPASKKDAGRALDGRTHDDFPDMTQIPARRAI